MSGTMSRRNALEWLGAGSIVTTTPGGWFEQSSQAPGATELHEALTAMPLADVHCHGGRAFELMTEDTFLEELAMPAWMFPAYFTINGDNIYQRWKTTANADERRSLDAKYGIQKKVSEVLADFRETAFVHYLVKEMAQFFTCKPTVRDVVAARNEYTKGNPWRYPNDLFAAIKLEDLYVTSTMGGLTTPQYASNLKSRVHPIYSVAGVERPLMEQNIPFSDLVKQHSDALRREILQNRHVGFKSHIATRAGLDIPAMDAAEIEPVWEQFRKVPLDARPRRRPGTLPLDAPERKILHFLTWQTCGIAYDLDVPFHIHSGDGGEGQGNLSRQYPYNMENVARWPVDYPQKPVKIVMVHGGYPHVDQAAYMSHIFPNVWYETSWMNPFANRGLRENLLAIFETAPFSKIMAGSDAYHGMPEINYVAGKWGRKYTAQALSVLVQDGVLTRDEAVRAGRLMLSENAHRLHKIKPATGTAL